MSGKHTKFRDFTINLAQREKLNQMGTVFCEDVVLDSVYMALWDEDSIIDQIFSDLNNEDFNY